MTSDYISVITCISPTFLFILILYYTHTYTLFLEAAVIYIFTYIGFFIDILIFQCRDIQLFIFCTIFLEILVIVEEPS